VDAELLPQKIIAIIVFGANSTTALMPLSFIQRLEESNDEVEGQTLQVQWLLSSLSAIVCWRDGGGVTMKMSKMGHVVSVGNC